VPNYSPPRTPVAGVGWANASRTKSNPNSSRHSASASSGLNSILDGQLNLLCNTPWYGPVEAKGEETDQEAPTAIHPEPLFTLPLALLPPPAEDPLVSSNSVSSGHTSSTYVSANETQSQTGQPSYSYRHQPASLTSTASTKSPVTPGTPLFVQPQSPAVDGVRARVII